MNNNLRKYMDDLFASAPQNKKTFELKEELLINMDEKYNDLLQRGYNEEDAFKQVVSGIGDVDELIAGIQQPNPFKHQDVQEQRRKSAFVVSICVGLYIFALISTIFIDEVTNGSNYSALALFGISAVSTCILIYHFMSRPKYERSEDTIVEEFKEWKSADQRRKSLVGALSSVLWSVIVCVYFIISFTFMNWHISWIIFLVGAVLNQVIRIFVDMLPGPVQNASVSHRDKKLQKSVIGLVWSLVFVVYFAVSFIFMNWHVSWIIFLAGGVVTSCVNLFFNIKKQ